MQEKYAKMFLQIKHSKEETMNKSYLTSKTLWTSLITLLLPLSPELMELAKENPEIATTIVGLVFGILRFFTSKKLGKK